MRDPDTRVFSKKRSLDQRDIGVFSFPGNCEGWSVQGRLIDLLSVPRTLDLQPGTFLGLAGFGPQVQVHSPLLSTPRPMVLNWDLHHQQKEYSFSLWLSLQKDDARKLMALPLLC